MKKKLLILSLLLSSSCSLFRENYKTVAYNSKNGDKLMLTVFEEREIFGREKSLKIYANEHNFKGKNCEDAELKFFGDELWREMVERNYVSEVKSGTVFVLKNQGAQLPDYCKFFYVQNAAGAWNAAS